LLLSGFDARVDDRRWLSTVVGVVGEIGWRIPQAYLERKVGVKEMFSLDERL
jgi:hypothetical protein